MSVVVLTKYPMLALRLKTWASLRSTKKLGLIATCVTLACIFCSCASRSYAPQGHTVGKSNKLAEFGRLDETSLEVFETLVDGALEEKKRLLARIRLRAANDAELSRYVSNLLELTFTMPTPEMQVLEDIRQMRHEIGRRLFRYSLTNAQGGEIGWVLLNGRSEVIGRWPLITGVTP